MKRLKLLELRLSLGVTHEQIAKAIRISRSYYGFIENGQRNPSLEVASRISSFFDRSINEVFPDIIFFGNRCYEMRQKSKETA